MIPGVLVAFYSLLAIVYVGALRTADACGEPAKVFLSGTCFRAWPLLSALALLGIGTAVAGVVAFAPNVAREGRQRLEHGSVARLGLVLLASVPSLALILYIVQSYRSISTDASFVISLGGTTYSQPALLLLATLLGLGALLPYLGLYVAQSRRVRAFDLQSEARMAGYPREVPPGAPTEAWVHHYEQPPHERVVAELAERAPPMPVRTRREP